MGRERQGWEGRVGQRWAARGREGKGWAGRGRGSLRGVLGRAREQQAAAEVEGSERAWRDG